MEKGEQIRDQIKSLLDNANITYRYMEHEETKTSEESAQIRGTKLSEGAKAIIMKGKKSENNIMVVVPADKRISSENVKSLLGEKYEFENPDVIFERYGLKVGAVPPFGNLLGLTTYVDTQIANSSTISFNCGLRTCSIIMDGRDFASLSGCEVGEFAE